MAIGIIWFIDSKFEYEPMVVIVSSIIAFISNGGNLALANGSNEETRLKVTEVIGGFFLSCSILIFFQYFSSSNYSPPESTFIRLVIWVITIFNFFISLSIITVFFYIGISPRYLFELTENKIDKTTIQIVVIFFISYLSVSYFIESNFTWLITRFVSVIYYGFLVIIVSFLIYLLFKKNRLPSMWTFVKLNIRVLIITTLVIFVLKIVKHPIGETIVAKIDQDISIISNLANQLVLYFS